MMQRLERDPTLAELAEAVDLTEEKVAEILRINAQDPLSLDTPIGDEDDTSMADFIPDKGAAPLDLAARKLLEQTIRDVLDDLSPREAEVVRLAFRSGRRAAPDAGRGRPGIRRHPGADPPDRVEDAGQVASPAPQRSVARLPRLTRRLREPRVPAPHSRGRQPPVGRLSIRGFPRAVPIVDLLSSGPLVKTALSGVAQLAEQLTVNQWVVGSSPTPGATSDKRSEAGTSVSAFGRFRPVALVRSAPIGPVAQLVRAADS